MGNRRATWGRNKKNILFAAKTGAHILKKDVGSGLITRAGVEVEEAKSSALMSEYLAKIFKA